MKFIAAKCPSCNGELQVPEERDFVKCMYCGVDVKVREAIAINLLNDTKNLKELAKYNFDIRNYEDANNYYTKILEIEVTYYPAWERKALIIYNTFSIKNPRDNEIVALLENALRYYDGDNGSEYKSKLGEILNDYCCLYMEEKRKSFKPFKQKIEDFFKSYQGDDAQAFAKSFLNRCDNYLRDLDFFHQRISSLKLNQSNKYLLYRKNYIEEINEIKTRTIELYDLKKFNKWNFDCNRIKSENQNKIHLSLTLIIMMTIILIPFLSSLGINATNIIVGIGLLAIITSYVCYITQKALPPKP